MALTLDFPLGTDCPMGRCFTAYGTIDPPFENVRGSITNGTTTHAGTNAQTLDGFWTIEFAVPSDGSGASMGNWTLSIENESGGDSASAVLELEDIC